jgi:hypothetical protein
MAVQTRPPTGKVAPPLILLEGGEKAGKSWSAAVLSASDKVGRTFWIDLGEGAADEYGAIPGVRYEVVIHDGTWNALYANVCEIRDLAHEAADRSEQPVVLVIDSMTQEWELLKDWANHRARESKKGREALAKDPNAEVDIPRNIWNDANDRHRRLMAKLMTFRGIVVMTARGKDVSATGPNGQPLPGKTGYSVEGQKGLGSDASVWIRLARDSAPIVVGARSVHSGIRPGVDKPVRLENFTLESLIFERLRFDPVTAQARDLATPRDAEAIREDALTKGVTLDVLQTLWKEARDADLHNVEVEDAEGQPLTLRQLIEARAKAATPKAVAS